MLTINCQSSIKLTEEKIIYFDPLNVEEIQDADYIFITHTHRDHFSKEDITKISYEPWHYRYVGKQAAEEITNQNITLEEYLKG